MPQPGPPARPAYNHPTDSGWAWVTVFAAAVGNFYVTGGVRSMGIMAVELIRYYNPNPILVQLITAFMGANFAIFSFIGNILGVRFTMHRIAITGAILTITGKFIAAIAPNMAVVILGLGIVSGMGYGFMFGPSMVLVGQYFVKRRALANGLAIGGGSIGQLVIPWFITGVTYAFAFRGGMLLYVGLALQALPAMCLLRDPFFYGPKPTAPAAPESGDKAKQKGDKIIIPRNVSEQSAERRSSVVQRKTSVSSLATLPGQNTLSLSVEDIAEQCNVEPEEVTPQMQRTSALRMICDTDLLCDPSFVLYMAAISLGHGGFMATCFFTPLYTNELWASESMNAALISVMGVTDLIGRILGGVVADLGLMPKPYLVCISFAICSLIVFILPSFPVPGFIFPCIILFGLVGGSYLSMLVVIVIELFTEQKLPIGLGLTTLCMGLSMIPIPPTLAGIARQTGSYGSALRVCGVLMLLGSILFGLIMPVWRHRRCKMVPDTATVGVQTSLLLVPAGKGASKDATSSEGIRNRRPSVDGLKSPNGNEQTNGVDYRWSRLDDADAPESNI